MFHLSSIKVHEACLKQFVRHLRRKVNRIDPGISQRKTMLENEGSNFEQMDFDDLESDFHSLGLTHREHLNEMEKMREREKLAIVKQKYFKEKYPNFLTWSDKQQIRLLHDKDPQEWSVEKLSESFPALPETIKKIIKSNWTKTSVNKIQNHDKSVSNNWENFKNGKHELPPDLTEHLNKFTARGINYNTTIYETKKSNINLPRGEFSDIITSYEKIKKKQAPEDTEIMGNIKINQSPSSSEDYLIDKEMEVKEQLTLREYKRVLETKSDLNIIDKDIITEIDNDGKQKVNPVQEIELDVVKYTNKSSGLLREYNSKTDYSHLSYPEKIRIPKDKRRRGCTYKLNDCYYDDDGEFLYRVPGIN